MLAERVRYWKDMVWREKVTLEPRENHSLHPRDLRYWSRGVVVRALLQPAEPSVDSGTAKNEYELTAVKMRNGNVIYPARTISLQPKQVVAGIDPGQDLLVLTSVPTTIAEGHMLLQFIHLTTGSSPHPRAAVPEVTIPATRMSIKEIQIVENICSVAYWAPGPENRTNIYEIIDWTTGRCILKVFVPAQLSATFRLISPARYVVATRQHPKEGLGGCALQVRMIEGDQLIATYNLPAFAPQLVLGVTLCRSEMTSKIESDTTFPFQAPFTSPPYPKLLLFHFMLVGGPDSTPGAYAFHMVVLSTCFFPTPEQLKPWPNNTIPWSVWGEHNSRIFLKTEFGPSVHMHRICTSDSVMDFNPIDIARDLCLGNEEDIWNQATIIPKVRGLFKEDVTTRLPFRVGRHRISNKELSYPTYRLDDCILVTEAGKLVHSFL